MNFSSRPVFYFFLWTYLFFAVFFQTAKCQTTPVMYVNINHYNHDQHVLDDQVQETSQIVKQLVFRSSVWNVKTTVKPVKGNDKAMDILVTFLCQSGHLDDASVSVNFSFDNWSVNNYVLMPAAVYNGNRVVARNIPYPSFINDPRDTGINKPQMISDVPRLDKNYKPSRIQLRTGDMSTPAIGFYDPAAKCAFWMLTPQGTKLGDSGIGVAEDSSRTHAEITYTAPVVREKYRYYISDSHAPSRDQGASFNTGDSVVLMVRVYHDSCASIPDLFRQFAKIRNDVIPHSKEEPSFRSFSTTFGIQQEKFNRCNFEPKFGYYSVGLRENASQDWQIGWVGGMISTYPLLYQGNKTSVDNVIRNFDWLFPKGIAPSGFFWDTGEKGDRWMGIFQNIPLGKDLHLIRKSGDGLYYCLKQFELMNRMHMTVKPPWQDGCRKVANTLVRTWKKYHQFGQFVNNKTGDIVIGGSTSGGIIPAALVLASRYYKDSSYQTVAKAAARDYYENFVKKGVSYGGPGEAMQNFDSESTYGLLESFTVLYEATHEKYWLQAAEDVALQFTTWITSYNYVFPPSSDLGRIDAHTTGTVWANTQNKHAAPGICTHSGVALLKLYRATGNPFYLELLKDIAHTIPQYMSTPDRPIANLGNGWINERVSLTDWLEGIGNIFSGSTWSETAMLLTEVEIPGLYVNLDDNELVAIDHVSAKIIRHSKRSVDVRICNPTGDKITVKLLAETKVQQAVMLGDLPLWGCRTLKLLPGGVKILHYLN
ncbi:hypothetical protein [Pedobacter sp. L105]|uniref:hypothetical protein n=1 Tax=Pedobacter sp. L105 TaxID=1641871 RepID=UPI00131A6FF7|nr:hypothetical protein [Pedobacter sp. L105]